VVLRGWSVGSLELCWGFEEKGGRGDENEGRCEDSACDWGGGGGGA
jgi:hypothetical protein